MYSSTESFQPEGFSARVADQHWAVLHGIVFLMLLFMAEPRRGDASYCVAISKNTVTISNGEERRIDSEEETLMHSPHGPACVDRELGFVSQGNRI